MDKLSPAQVISAIVEGNSIRFYRPHGWRSGSSKAKDISTSFVERQNLPMRMQMRRFTRLTNAFSKKIDKRMRGCAPFHALQLLPRA